MAWHGNRMEIKFEAANDRRSASADYRVYGFNSAPFPSECIVYGSK